MWEFEHSVETGAAPEAVWRIWADVPGWHTWNPDIEAVRIDGPFAEGSVIEMTPAGQDPVRLRVAEIDQHRLFVDEAEFGGVVIRTTHRLDRLDSGRTRVVYRTQISGPAAGELGPRIGPAITADFPETMAALVRLAER